VTQPPLSASQVKTFKDCNLSWYFAYIEGKRSPDTASTKLGKEVHAELEAWGRDGKAPTNPIAAAGMHHAPPPGIGTVEQAIELSTPNSPWRGFIDRIWGVDRGLAVDAFTTPHALILDFKTSANIAKYAKTAEELAEDAQANLYAFWAFLRLRDAGYAPTTAKVSGRWVYLATRGKPAAKPVDFCFDRSRVSDVVYQLDATGAEIQKLYSIRPKAEDVAFNTNHCDSWGGCAHKAYCPGYNRTALSIGDAMSDDFMSAISKLVDAQPAPVRIPPPPPPPPKLTVPPPPPPPPTAGAQSDVSVIEPDAEAMEALKGYMRDAMKLSEDKIEEYTRPKVEHGFINSPEGPEYPVASPEELTPVVDTKADVSTDSLDSMDRDALKAFAVHLGVVAANARFQAPKLKELIRGVTGYVGALETYQAGVGVQVPAGAVEDLASKMREEPQTNCTVENDEPAPGVEPVVFESVVFTDTQVDQIRVAALESTGVAEALTKIAEALEAIRKVMAR
jgi:RecB family exonuclease